MRTEFKDVAHLYKGVMMRTKMGDFPLIMYHNGAWWLDTDVYGANAVEDDIKPLLRSLDSMTEEERAEHLSLQVKWPVTAVHKLMCVGESPQSFAYLLSKNFDLFNLLPSGQAIQKI